MASDGSFSSATNVSGGADDRVVCITTNVVVNGSEQIHLNADALRSVLMEKDIIDLPVAIYSIAGPKKSGKSFLLNLFSRRINQITNPTEKAQNLDEEELKNFFSWRGGTIPHTKGIYLLKRPFLIDVDVPVGDKGNKSTKVAFFLMDTQGIFDTEIPKEEHAIISTFSFLISSKLFFNLKQSIESVHWDHIYNFAEISNKVRDTHKDRSPIQDQSLMFIIRDWEIDDHLPGFDGGEEYLESCLDGDDVALEYNLKIDHCMKTFGEIACTLFPPPEKDIRKRGKEWKPCFIKSIGEEFMEQATDLFQRVLYPLSVKEINGKKVTCGQLFEHIHLYGSVLNARKDLKDIARDIAWTDCIVELKELVTDFADKYAKDLWSKISSSKYDPTKDESAILSMHATAMNSFDEKKKPDSRHLIERFRNGLDNLLKYSFKIFKICKCAERIWNEEMEHFKKEINSSPAGGAEDGLKKLDKAAGSLEDKLDPAIVEQCCYLFVKQGINEIQKRFRRGNSNMLAATGSAVAVGGVLARFGPSALLLGGAVAAVGLGIAGITLLTKGRGVEAKLESSCQGINIENYEISISFNLSCKLKFGEIIYPFTINF